MTKIQNELKQYDEVSIVKVDGKKYVRKKVNSEEMAFYHFVQGTDFAKYVLIPEKVMDGVALFPFVEGGTILKKSKDLFAQTVTAIAELSALPESNLNLPIICHEKYNQIIDTLISLADKGTVSLKQENLFFMRDFLSEVCQYMCIVHDDMIALNVLDDSGSIKIIDWEHIKVSFVGSDISRFLYDLYFDTPCADKFYYPKEWATEFEELYIQLVSKSKSINPEFLAKAILFGRLLNYAKVIYAGVNKKDIEKDPWLMANIDAFNRTSSDKVWM